MHFISIFGELIGLIEMYYDGQSQGSLAGSKFDLFSIGKVFKARRILVVRVALVRRDLPPHTRASWYGFLVFSACFPATFNLLLSCFQIARPGSASLLFCSIANEFSKSIR